MTLHIVLSRPVTHYISILRSVAFLYLWLKIVPFHLSEFVTKWLFTKRNNNEQGILFF